jgi:hypothetical protein
MMSTMSKPTYHTEMTSSFPRKQQIESTLYMPSMYDSDEEGADTRDEDINSGRVSRFALQRCLAWSQDEAEFEEDRMETGETEDNSLTSFCSIQPALVDSEAGKDQIATTTVRNIHWGNQITSDQKLECMLHISIEQALRGKHC